MARETETCSNCGADTVNEGLILCDECNNEDGREHVTMYDLMLETLKLVLSSEGPKLSRSVHMAVKATIKKAER